MRITNTTKSDLGITAEHVVPALGFLDVEEGDLAGLEANKVVRAWFENGQLVGEIPKVEDLDTPDEDADRVAAIQAAIEGLSADDMTAAGAPKVAAVNLLMPEGGAPVTAAEIEAAIKAGKDE